VSERGSDIIIEQNATYAYGRKKFINKSVNPGEGLIGQCYLERDRIYLKHVPKDYIRITSGLGEALPNVVVIEPLINRKEVVGLIELAWFTEPAKYQLKALEEIGIELAAIIRLERDERVTAKLLIESEEKTSMLQSKEAELSQNLAEMREIQKKMQSREEELSRALEFNKQQSVQHQMTEIRQLIEHTVNDFNREMLFLTQIQPVAGMVRALQADDFDDAGDSSFSQWRDRFIGNVTSLMASKKIYKCIDLHFNDRGLVCSLHYIDGQVVNKPSETISGSKDSDHERGHVYIIESDGQFCFALSNRILNGILAPVGYISLQMFSHAVTHRFQTVPTELGFFELHDSQGRKLVTSRSRSVNDDQITFPLSPSYQLTIQHFPC